MRTVTVRIPDELHRKLKVKMAEKDRTIQSLILELVSGAVEEESDIAK